MKGWLTPTFGMLRLQLLLLWRDRGALALSFLLPPLLFVIFAAIFSGASGQDLALRVSVGAAVESSTNKIFLEKLADSKVLRITTFPVNTIDALRPELENALRGDHADIAVLLSADLAKLTEQPITIMTDPARTMAQPIVQGEIQRAYRAALPDLAARQILQPLNAALQLSPEQNARMKSALRDLRDAPASNDPLTSVATLSQRGKASGSVTYYAGAVAILFLLLSAMHASIGIHDERSNGIIDRLLVLSGSSRVLVSGRFLFITLLGLVQCALIFAIGWLGFDLPWPDVWLPWLITSVLAGALAGGVTLLATVLAKSRAQAQSLCTFGILVLSALGGSMVPRFLMPAWLQELGWLTPNAWVITAYSRVFQPDSRWGDYLLPWAVMGGVAILLLLLALLFVRRLEKPA
jgi:ABC-2 type transport system permease protein